MFSNFSIIIYSFQHYFTAYRHDPFKGSCDASQCGCSKEFIEVDGLCSKGTYSSLCCAGTVYNFSFFQDIILTSYMLKYIQ